MIQNHHGTLKTWIDIFMPMISFCVTTYRTADTVQRFLDSFHGMRMEYEIVVVDSMSDDGTVEALRGHADLPIRIYSLKCTRGKGRQTAFKFSGGEYVVFLDADIKYNDLCGFVEEALVKYGDIVISVATEGVPGLTLIAGPHRLIEELGGFPDLNFGEDVYFSRVCDAFAKHMEIKKKADFAEVIERHRPLGNSGEHRYSADRIDLIKRWIQKSGDVIVAFDMDPPAFLRFNQANRPGVILKAMALYIIGHLYRTLFIKEQRVGKRVMLLNEKIQGGGMHN